MISPTSATPSQLLSLGHPQHGLKTSGCALRKLQEQGKARLVPEPTLCVQVLFLNHGAKGCSSHHPGHVWASGKQGFAFQKAENVASALAVAIPMCSECCRLSQMLNKHTATTQIKLPQSSCYLDGGHFLKLNVFFPILLWGGRVC